MRRPITLIDRISAFGTAIVFVVAQLTLPAKAQAAPGSSTASAGSVAPPGMQAIQSFQPDLFTGRATTAIPIASPPGRKGLQPSMALSYSSSARNSWLGVGWSLDTGYIERSTKNGVPKYDSSDVFAFMFQGITSELVQIPDGTFRAKDEGLFLRFEQKSVSGWEVRDKSGTRYLFGQTAASQAESLGKTFRWYLDKVIDVNGNTVAFSYTKDQGQIYLSQIDYTGHETGGVQDLPPANQVKFLLDTVSRPDVEISYRSGFAVTTAKRLSTIETYATIAGSLSLARRYNLAYTASQRTGRSLLSSVTQAGSDGSTALPATTFSYQQNDSPSFTTASRNNPSVSTAAWNFRQAGLDTGHDNFGCVQPYAGLPWESPTVVTGSAGMSCLTANVSGNGDITVNGCQDHFMHAWTWVFSSTAKSVSLSYSGAEACIYKEDSGGVAQIGGDTPGGVSIPLQAGWSIIHLTGYHQHEGWTNVLTGSLKNQVDVMSAAQFIKPQLAGDADGNAITDLIAFDATNHTWTVSLGQASTTSPGTIWLSSFGDSSFTPILGDWNGDGRTDVGLFKNGSWDFANSTGSAFQITPYASPSLGSGTPLTGDFNGDGLIDVGVFNSGTPWQIALNTGSGFVPTSSFSFSWGTGGGYEPLTGDFNGDGLTDLAIAYQADGNISVAYSNGTQFVPASEYLPSFGAGQSHFTADFNGDGLTDIGYYDKATGQIRYALSQGMRFGTPGTLPVAFSLRSSSDQAQVGDFNGDGIADPAIFSTTTGAAELAYSQGTTPDLLSGINNGTGGSTSLQYQISSQCDNMCPVEHVPKLPFAVSVVNRVTVNDGMGHDYATTYVYKQGRYDAASKEFRGFAEVEARDADANVTITEFYQDDIMRGRPFRTQFEDKFGNLWTKQEQTWSTTNPYPGVNFVKLDQTDNFIYDGDATFRQIRGRFEYDSYGNLTTAYEDGDVAITGDERRSATAYSLNETAWILNKPKLVQTLDGLGVVVAQRRFYYDGALDAATAPSKGNLTKEEEWLAQPPSPEQWLATSLTYDSYGNLASVTDALLRTTTNTYDANGTFLIQIKNAKNHTRALEYNARTGQVTKSTDQNGVVTTTEYDALGRVSKVIGPNDSSAYPTISYQYDLSPTAPSRAIVSTRIKSGDPAVLTAYSFTDGLGRAIQTRSPAEDSTKQVVSGAVELNNRGLAVKQWVSYLDASSTSYVAPATASLAPPVQYEYDPMGRMTKTITPDGVETTTTYNDDEAITRVTDHETRKRVDAYGRLIRVEEIASPTETYATTYAYDTLGNLTTVTDAKGNTTQIQYDSLGRKTGMDDPDMGHWSYAYDAVDNLTSQTDARGVTTTFAYDELNRVASKTYAVPLNSGIPNPGTVSYFFDEPNAANPATKGKLTRVTDGSGSSAFEYDNLGRLIKETKTVDGTSYVVNRAYDLLGRLTSLTYPDGEIAAYAYNTQGGIETVSLQPTSGSAQPIVTNIDYNAAGQMLKIAYGNGTVTDYSYNPQTLRLDHLQTNGPSGLLQDFRYSFNALGNVTGIQDAVHTGTQTFTYDTLSRLTGATGAYGVMAYRYDPIGNMLEKEGLTMSYGLANGSKPHAVTSAADALHPERNLGITYDANGNMLTKAPADPTLSYLSNTYTYDAENRLVQVDSPQQETVNVTFKPGWNFFSLAVIPDNASIESILPNFSQNFEQVARYDASTSSFKHYVGDSRFDDFSTLEYGTGYQVYCKATSNVTVSISGKLLSKKLSKQLAAGWHLLPATSLQQTVAGTAFAGLSYDQILDVNSQSVSQVKPSEAYYVHLTTSGTFSPFLPRSPTTQFVFDGDGGRVKQVTASTTTTFVGEILEKDSTGKTTKYLFAGSQRIAAKSSTDGLLFYHTDHLGSSDLVTDSTGQTVEHTEHLPYGAISVHSGTKNLPQKFTGQRQDTATGLILFPARAYDPQLGRFIQPDPYIQDPSDPQTLNRYSYVQNNPINLVDPSGNFAFLAFLGALLIKAAVGAAIGAAVSLGIGAVTGQIHSWNDAGRFALVGAASGAVIGAGGVLIGSEGLALSGGAKILAELGIETAATALGGGIDTAMQGYGFSSGARSGALFGAAFFAGGLVLGAGFRAVAQTQFGRSIGEGINSMISAINNSAAAQSLRRVLTHYGPEVVNAGTFDDIMQWVETLDFGTKPNEAVFYSGKGQYAQATQFARATGRKTIEMTRGGQALLNDPLFQSLSIDQQDLVFQKASAPFAQGASGKVHAFVKGAHIERTFRSIEEPILDQNSKIYGRTYHY